MRVLPKLLGELFQLPGELFQLLGELAQLLGELSQLSGEVPQAELSALAVIGITSSSAISNLVLFILLSFYVNNLYSAQSFWRLLAYLPKVKLCLHHHPNIGGSAQPRRKAQGHLRRYPAVPVQYLGKRDARNL